MIVAAMGTTYRLREPDGERGEAEANGPTEHSGAFNRTQQPATPDDFEEPDLLLLSLSEQAQPKLVPGELAAARKLIRERDQRILELEQRVSRLEGELTESRRAVAPTLAEPSAPSRALPATPAPSLLDHPTLIEPTLTEFEPYPTLTRLSLSMLAVKPESSSAGSGGTDTLPPASSDDGVPSSRRRRPRLALELELEFTEDTHFFAGITQDLSEGGVFVATYRVLPVSTLLWLAFELPGGTQVRTRGEVRWIREEQAGSLRPGMGVAFLELPEAALVAITRYCRDRAPIYMEF